MKCHYCQTSNHPDEHRCQRCGRRFDDARIPRSRSAYAHHATARALDYNLEPNTEPVPVAPAASANHIAPATTAPAAPERHTPYQPSLFKSRVVSLESYAPEAIQQKPKRRRAPSRPRAAVHNTAQDAFDFETVITSVPEAPRIAQPAVTCDARVASRSHRVIAVGIDLSFVFIGLVLFLGVFNLAGGDVFLRAHTLAFCGAAAVALFLIYELLWCFADMDSAGMRAVKLRLINLDGRRPTHHQRLVRLGSSCLGLMAAGLGLIWALVDEETLTWHDHMSKTFPTPAED